MLQQIGWRAEVIDGGYRTYRRLVNCYLYDDPLPHRLVALDGFTGTAKTDLLKLLQARGTQVLDLEGLANHRGSSYGALMLPPQPSTEQYENLIAEQWLGFDPQRPVWIEAESRRVGICCVPPEIMNQMEAAPTLEVLRSKSERLEILVQVYGDADPAQRLRWVVSDCSG